MKRLLHLLRDARGTMAIETAITLPTLILLGLGSFQVSDAVARRSEMQTAASEALQIALASKPRNEGDLNRIGAILRTSTGLGDNNVTVTFRYRCGTGTTIYDESGNCGSGAEWVFVRIRLTETYQPFWTSLGLSGNIPLNIDRTVQIS